MKMHLPFQVKRQVFTDNRTISGSPTQQSVIQSVLGQDTEPEIAPGNFISVSLCVNSTIQYMQISVNLSFYITIM